MIGLAVFFGGGLVAAGMTTGDRQFVRVLAFLGAVAIGSMLG